MPTIRLPEESEHNELVRTSRTMLDQQKRMLARAVAVKSAPYELYAHTHALGLSSIRS